METTGFREMENSILKVLRVFLFKSMKQVTFRMNLFTYILLKTLRSNDADGNENVKRIIGFISKKTSAHVITLYCTFRCPFLHDYGVKMPNFAFYGVRKQPTTNFFFFF